MSSHRTVRAGWLLDECPSCGSERLEVVTDDVDVNFRCDDCGRCWHVDFGRVSRVDPYSCSGCPHRSACIARLHALRLAIL